MGGAGRGGVRHAHGARNQVRRPDRRGGMTLLEVLLAMGIFASILVLLLSSFTGADRARSVISSRAREIRRIQMTLDRLASDLAGAFSSDAVEACGLAGREDLFGKLRASTLSFTAFVPPDVSADPPEGDLVKIRYFPRQTADARFLELRRETSVFPLIESRVPAREVLLSDELLAFRVEYFDGVSWVRDWPPPGKTRSAMPQRILVSLTDSRGVEYRRMVPIPLAGQASLLPYSGRRKAQAP